jgi:eukaryotic-like serine/threonine-protein kinase
MNPKSEGATIVAERYRLIRRVGQGGLASVWEAEHVTLGSPVAIKFLHRTGPEGGEQSERFLREARIAASVKHRNVVDIIDFGFTDVRVGEAATGDERVPYMVMELLKGRTLGALLEAERCPALAQVVDIALGTLRGLTAVHDSGLVHRDLKPHNVFLVDDEDGAFPKLVDFGLSRRAGRTDLTTEGMLLGTPQYMSPEQAAGRVDLDARTDVYTMGVVLYEMLAGRLPFPSGSLAETLDRVLHDAPTPLRQAAPAVPEPIALVVETAMAKDRARRYMDARAMRAALVLAVPFANEAKTAPTLPRIDAHARTIPAGPAVVLPAPSTPRLAPRALPPERGSGEVAETTLDMRSPAPRRESRIVVAVRVAVLGAITLGVALLVLDGPWGAGPSSTALTVGAAFDVADAGGAEVDAAAPAAVLVAADDAASIADAGTDAALGDAGISDDSGLDDAGAADEPDAGLSDAGAGAIEPDAAIEREPARRARPRRGHPRRRTTRRRRSGHR